MHNRLIHLAKNLLRTFDKLTGLTEKKNIFSEIMEVLKYTTINTYLWKKFSFVNKNVELVKY